MNEIQIETISQHPIYVICMEREIDRKTEIEKHLSKLGIQFDFFNAVDGHLLTQEQLKRYSEERSINHAGRPLAKGEIGCYLSHTGIWQTMVDSNIEKAFIIESDAVLSEETIESVAALYSSETRWELAMLFYRECYPSIWGKRRLTKRSSLVKFSNKSSCTTAYTVTLKGAKKLLENAYPAYMPVDDYMTGGYIKKNINTYAVFPKNVILTEDALESSSIRKDLFPMLEKLGIERRLPNEVNNFKEFEKSVRRFIKKLLPPPSL